MDLGCLGTSPVCRGLGAVVMKGLLGVRVESRLHGPRPTRISWHRLMMFEVLAGELVVVPALLPHHASVQRAAGRFLDGPSTTSAEDRGTSSRTSRERALTSDLCGPSKPTTI